METFDLNEYSGAMIEANELKDKILKAEDVSNGGKTTYYAAEDGDDRNDGLTPDKPVKSLMRLRSFPLRSGDKVLFKRGSVFRTQEPFFLYGGVFYGAYGSGVKPRIYGSLHNYAEPYFWKVTAKEEHVWELVIDLDEVGCIVFDEETKIGVRKRTREELKNNGDFYYDFDTRILEMYCDCGNPGDCHKEIEIASAKELVYGTNVNGVRIDNLCFKYVTCLAVKFGNSRDITITNCELGWIGGGVFASGNRYGNAIQFWHRGENIAVEHCWIYQVFDAALTFQGRGTGKSFFNDVRFEHNLIELCSMNFEFWLGRRGQNSSMRDILFANNIVRLGAYGWGGTQREKDKMGNQALFLSWNYHYDEMENFVCTENIFDCADCNMIFAETPQQQQGLKVFQNVYYQKRTTGRNPFTEILRKSGLYANNQEELEIAIATFDEQPKFVRWLG